MATLFAGRYQLGELVGTGGMGEVWSAVDTRLHRQVALKLVPLRTLSANDRERIVREARSTARLRHPNVVTLFDAGEADGAMYLVMELVRGDTLADRLAGRPLEPTEATRILAAVLDALGAAHAAGIVHRDIKPANVLLGPGGEVKLADFGIARQLDSVAADLTATGMHIGTPRYLAPEVFGGSVATPASDVYSAGVMLFEMLTGRVPFDGATAVATAMAHVGEPVPDPRAANPAVSDGLAAVAMRAMAKEPSQRFASPAEMRRALVAATTRQPSGAVAPTQVMPSGARAMGWSAGRWWVAAALVAIAVGVVAAVAVLRGGDGDDVTTAPVGSTGPAVSALDPAGEAGAVPASSPAPPTAPPQPVEVETAGGDVADAPAPSSVEELVALLDGDPAAYGSRTPALIDRLEKVGRGRKATDRAIELLAEAERWVADGELDPVVLDLLRPVLAPIADGPGNGNGNGNGRR